MIYKKGDTILMTSVPHHHPHHITLLKLLEDPDKMGCWNDYMCIQISHDEKAILWPTRYTGMKFELRNVKLTTDIKAIMNFKEDYTKAIFGSGYKFKEYV